MTLGPALDVAISLTFIYLLLSLLGSGIKEGASALLNLRGKALINGLKGLLSDAPQSGKVVDFFGPFIGKMTDFLSGGKIFGKREKESADADRNSSENTAPADQSKSLFFESIITHHLIAPPSGSSLPSYIAARTFSTVLIDTLINKGAGTVAFSDIQAAIKELPEGRAQKVLSALASQAGGSLTKFRDSVERWFDDSMDRVSGAYKRFATNFLLIFGLIAAMAGNIDSITLVRALWTQPALRAAATQNASAFYETTSKAAQAASAAATATATADSAAEAASAPAAADKSTAASAAEAASVVAKSKEETKRLLKQLTDLGLPIGWSKEAWTSMWHWDSFFARFLGWMITASAVSLGAPFWFDLLGNALKLRAAGPKPERSAKE
jgi:methyl-accepting chemotaxis protein